MRKKRNVFEHFGRVDNIQALRGAMGAALHVLVDLLADAEDAGLLPAASSGAPTTLAQDLSTFDRFTQARMNDVRPQLKGTEAFECPSCTQIAARIEDGLDCLFCGTRTVPEEAANYYVESVMKMSAYETVKDGGEWPVYECCDCSEEALVQLNVVEAGQRGFICFGCSGEFDCDALHRCEYCNRFMRAREEVICAECFAEQVGRD